MKKIYSIKTLIICLIALGGFVSSCDNDDDDESGSSEVVLLSFGPSGVHHGETIKFIGQNLNKVSSIVLAPALEIPAAQFTSQSGDVIELVIPEAAESGKVILKTPEGDIESKTILSFEVPVTVTSVPAEAKPGTNITITGDMLNWVETVTFATGLVVEKADFVSQSMEELVITVPMAAQSGYLNFATGGTEPLLFDSEEILEVTLPSVTALNPASIRHDNDLTIEGTDLDLVSEIKFPDGSIVLSENFVSQSVSSIVVTVPVTSTAGKLELMVPSGLTILSTDLTIILPNVTALNPSDPQLHTAGSLLTLTGTDLDLVKEFKFPNVAEVVTDFTKTATQIQVTIPTGAEGGTLVMKTIHDFTVPVTLPFGNQLVLAKTIFDESPKSPFGAGGGWGGVTTNAASTENPRVGSVSIKVDFVNSWGGGAQFGTWGNSPLDASGTTYFAFSIYGGAGTNGKEINVNVSGVQAIVAIEEGKWKDVTIPLTSVGNPASIGEVWFQDRGFTGTVFIDHIGLK